jgi:hypothetical protein
VGVDVSDGVGESVGMDVWEGGTSVAVRLGNGVGVGGFTVEVADGGNDVDNIGGCVVEIDGLTWEQPANINPVRTQKTTMFLFIFPSNLSEIHLNSIILGRY